MKHPLTPPTPLSPASAPLPPRLVDGRGAGADLLRRVLRQSPPSNEQAGWNELVARLARGHGVPRLPLGLAAGAGALAGAVVVLWLLLPRSPVTPITARSAPVRSPSSVVAHSVPAAPLGPSPRKVGSAPSPAGSHVVRVALGRAPVSLPPGEVEVGSARSGGEARITLSSDAAALASEGARGPKVELLAGAIDLDVSHQVAARRFRVFAGAYRFVVLGTSFRVERGRRSVALHVREGTVAVEAGNRRLTLVTAGRSWRGAAPPSHRSPRFTAGQPATALHLPPPAAAVAGPFSPTNPVTGPPALAVDSPLPAPARLPDPVPSLTPIQPPVPSPPTLAPAPLEPPAADLAACADRAELDARAGLDCFMATARRGGLTGEVALYKAARLQRDGLADAAAALRLFDQHRRQYPDGSLRQEVEVSIVELLPRLNRHREALEVSAALLAAWPSGERTSDLRLIRGNIYREVYRDHARAAVEYATAVDAGGPSADPAAFWRAVCLEQLGRPDEAMAAYRAYLARPAAERAAEARTRLETMSRELFKNERLQGSEK